MPDETSMMPTGRHQFVFLMPCGCPLGLIEGSYAKSEDRAWGKFCDSRVQERALRNRGVTVAHVSHAEYVEKFYPLMLAVCPHEEGNDRD